MGLGKMNLTDFIRTPIHRVLELIRCEAARYGSTVARSELVGLTPQQPLLDAAAWHLRLDLDSDQVLEKRLQDERVQTPTLFLDTVAADTPAPGGGSVAVLTGALVAALATMVARLTLGRKRHEEVQAEMESLVAEADSLRITFTTRIVQDAEAYDQVMAAFRLLKGTSEERNAHQTAIQEALVHAAEVPLATARDTVAALELVYTAARLGNINTLTMQAPLRIWRGLPLRGPPSMYVSTRTKQWTESKH
jgi:formiminotetrahydrofolate cyclodeaminase